MYFVKCVYEMHVCGGLIFFVMLFMDGASYVKRRYLNEGGGGDGSGSVIGVKSPDYFSVLTCFPLRAWQ